MYNTSAAYKAALLNRIQSPTLSATLVINRTVSGETVATTYNLTNNNIVEGSLSIDSQGGDENNIQLGAVFATEIEATLCNLPDAITVGDFKSASISFAVSYGNETLPLTPSCEIAEAKWTQEGVGITAYDDMSKLNIPFSIGNSTASASKTAYQWYTAVCTASGLTAGTPEADFQYICNGTATLKLYSADGVSLTTAPDGVDTWRDLLFYLCQALGCFAVISRSGTLDLVPYGFSGAMKPSIATVDLSTGVVDSVELADGYIQFGGIKVEDSQGNVRYYGYKPDECDKIIQAYNRRIDELTVQRQADNNKVQDIEAERNALDNAYDAWLDWYVEYVAERASLLAEQDEWYWKYQQGQITEQEYLTKRSELNHEIELLDLEYQSRRMSDDEYTRQRAQYTAEINALEEEIISLNGLIDTYDTMVAFYTNQKDSAYAESSSIDMGYNPFLGATYSILWSDPSETVKWNLVELVTYLRYYSFTADLIGNNGLDVGDSITIKMDSGESTPGYRAMVNGYTYDGDILSLRGFGGASQLQGVKSKSDTGARTNISVLFSQVSDLQTGMDSVSERVRDGKRVIASAITDQGVTTSSDASFNDMAGNIRQIKTEKQTILEFDTASATEFVKVGPVEEEYNVS